MTPTAAAPEPAETGSTAEARPGVRKLTDPQALRALAHPMRLRLLEEVGMHGALTATRAAELLGGTAAAAAYHLRTLGKYGFLEEAEGGTGRERPWRINATAIGWDEDAEDPEERMTARALTDVVYARWLRRLEYYRAHHDQYPERLRQVSGAAEMVLFATLDEVEQAQREVMAVFERFADRITDPSLRPAGATPIDMLLFTLPFERAGEESTPLEEPGSPPAHDAGAGTDDDGNGDGDEGEQEQGLSALP